MPKVLISPFLFLLSLTLLAQTKQVHHAYGKTPVPVNPQRIVVLDTSALDAILSLGLTPVGVAFDDYNPDALIPPYLESLIDPKSVTSVGKSTQPNFEKISLLKPDLILASDSYRGRSSLYPSLSKIAPTVISKGKLGGSEWKQEFQFFAQVLGREELAREKIQIYEEKGQKLTASLLARYKTPPHLKMLRFMPTLSQLIKNETFLGSVLSDWGLELEEIAGSTYAHFVPLGLENIPLLESDVIFYSYHLEPMGKGKLTVSREPDFFSHILWRNLNVVKNKRVFLVPDSYWIMGKGITASFLILEDLENFLGSSGEKNL